MIDLRSDTITMPTEAMRKAMAEAVVGDDIYGEDPTVNRLQEMVAEMLGKEDALLVTSGTQGNQIAILTHCLPGTEVILEADAHIFYYEGGAGAALAGVQLLPLPGERGALSAAQVEKAIRPDDIHLPPTSLVCLENTHNRAGGVVIPLESMAAVYRVASSRGIPVHLDGARLFNAAVASGVPVKEYTAYCDTVQVCLSKGLGAPVGSVIAGSKSAIEKARRWRKRLGGGMRQAGIIAAPGIVALETMIERLAEDHANARYLAEGLAELPGIEFNPADVDTNIIIAKPSKITAQELIARLEERSILTILMEPDRIRFTTNKEVNRRDMETTLKAVRELLA
ncbi:MAG: low-specificity L-threonine aldolase [Bacillota bacterium]